MAPSLCLCEYLPIKVLNPDSQACFPRQTRGSVKRYMLFTAKGRVPLEWPLCRGKAQQAYAWTPADSACGPAVSAHCAVVSTSSVSPSSESVNVRMVPVSSKYQSLIFHHFPQPRMNAILNHFSTTHYSKVKRALGVMSLPYLKSFSGLS